MKKFLAIMLTFVLCFGVLSIAFAAEKETAVPDGYTGVYTAEDLDNIRNNLSGKYILMNDIDLSSYGNWNPIGTSEAPFTGELDGNGYSVCGMTIDKECTDGEKMYFALFTAMKNSKVIDLNVLNINIDVKFTGTDSDIFRAGALAGYANNCTIENCVASGNISLDGFNEGDVGGFFGKENMCFPTNCVNYADISVTAEKVYSINAGGISGVAAAVIKSSNYGNITVSSLKESYGDCYVGGIVGGVGNTLYGSSVKNCYNRGNVSVDFSTPGVYIGGLIGEGYIIINSYNTGDISIPENFSGYAGAVSGNIVMSMLADESGNSVKNIYYINDNMIPSYVDEAIPEDYLSELLVNVCLLTEEEFKTQESFVGFDFDTVWEMEENGYPILQNQPALPEHIPVTPSTETTIPTTTELSTTQIVETTVTESTTKETETTQPTTMVPTTEAATTQPATEENTEPTTEESTTLLATETTTEPSTEPDDTGEEPCWLVRILKKIIDFFVWIFSALGC